MPLIGRDAELQRSKCGEYAQEEGGAAPDAGGRRGSREQAAHRGALLDCSSLHRDIRARAVPLIQPGAAAVAGGRPGVISGVLEEDSDETVRLRVEARLADLLEAGEPLAQAVDVLGETLGLAPGGSPVSGADPEIRRRVLAARCDRCWRRWHRGRRCCWCWRICTGSMPRAWRYWGRRCPVFRQSRAW